MGRNSLGKKLADFYYTYSVYIKIICLRHDINPEFPDEIRRQIQKIKLKLS